MPSLSKSTQNSPRLLPLSFGIIAILASSTLLTACGGGGSGTARNTGGTPTTPVEETTFKLKVHSQVEVQNATVRLFDAETKKEIASKNISKGSDFEFDIKQSDASGRLILAVLSGQGSSGTYYDPTLNRLAPIPANTSLHSLFYMVNADGQIAINPFTEISYQRALVRAGNIDLSNPDYSLVDALSLSPATSETITTFGVNPNLITPSIAQKTDLNKLIYNLDGVENPPNTKPQYFNIFMGMGHYMVQKNENPTDQSPYFTFAKRAATDMRDGSLDGYTIFGDGVNGGNRLANPIMTNVKENTFPELTENTLKAIADYQQPARADYGARLKNKGVLSFFSTLSTKDPAGVKLFTDFNYIEGTSAEIPIGSFKLHSYSAGNYKRAFGINPITIKPSQAAIIYDAACKGTSQPNESKVDDIVVYPDCQIGLNADDTTGDFNAIEPLVGKYTSTDGCKLSISFGGVVTLSKGNQSLSANISRDESDALIRLAPNSQSYVMNVASPSTSPAEFIQFRIEHQKILSAVAGATTAKYPTSLMPSEQKFSCTFN